MKKTWFEEKLDSYKDNPIFVTHEKILDITEQIVIAMKTSRIKKKELAEKLCVKPSFISKILSGDHNLTIATMTKVAMALDLDYKVLFHKRGLKHEEDHKPGCNVANGFACCCL